MQSPVNLKHDTFTYRLPVAPHWHPYHSAPHSIFSNYFPLPSQSHPQSPSYTEITLPSTNLTEGKGSASQTAQSPTGC